MRGIAEALLLVAQAVAACLCVCAPLWGVVLGGAVVKWLGLL